MHPVSLSFVVPPDEPVRIVPYDPVWPERFERERAALLGAIGDWVGVTLVLL